MSVTYQNEDGRTLTVEVGDTITVRSFATSFGVPHLVTEVAPRADSSEPAISAVNRNGDYVDVHADRVQNVTPGNVRPELIQSMAPLTGAAPGTILNEAAYTRENGMLRPSARRPADSTRGASAPSSSSTGNS